MCNSVFNIINMHTQNKTMSHAIYNKLAVFFDGIESTPTTFATFPMDVLNKKKGVTTNDTIICKMCGEKHILECGIDKKGKKTQKLMFYKCGKKSFLGAVDSKKVC